MRNTINYENLENKKSNKLSRVLLLNFTLLAAILLTFKLPIMVIALLVLMPMYCKLYLSDNLFLYFTPLDLFSTTIFALSIIPGGTMLILFDLLKLNMQTITTN